MAKIKRYKKYSKETQEVWDLIKSKLEVDTIEDAAKLIGISHGSMGQLIAHKKTRPTKRVSILNKFIDVGLPADLVLEFFDVKIQTFDIEVDIDTLALLVQKAGTCSSRKIKIINLLRMCQQIELDKKPIT